jgi:hypothetical protein
VTSLEIHINSPGGDVFEGTTIHNMIKAHKAATKTVIIDGLAASIASIIAMAGDKIVMPKNAMMMIHDPSMVAWGRPEDLTKAADTLTKVRGTLVSTYADRTGLDAAEVAQLMAEETWVHRPGGRRQGLRRRDHSRGQDGGQLVRRDQELQEHAARISCGAGRHRPCARDRNPPPGDRRAQPGGPCYGQNRTSRAGGRTRTGDHRRSEHGDRGVDHR